MVKGFLVIAGAALFLATAARAQAPRVIGFQGRLNTPAGTPVPDNPAQAMTFGIYDTATGGSPLWSTTKSVSVKGGVFQTSLGDATPLPAGLNLSDKPYYLEVSVGSETLSPRFPLLGSPYAVGLALPPPLHLDGGALHLDYNDTATDNASNGLIFGGAGSGEGIWSNRSDSTPGKNLYGLTFATNLGTPRMSITNGGNVGIGTEAPAHRLDVIGDAHVSGNLTANNAPGVAYASVWHSRPGVKSAYGTNTPVDTVTVNVPSTGYLFVTAMVQFDGGSPDFDLYNTSTIPETWLFEATAGSDDRNLNLSYVLPVTAGQVHLRTMVHPTGGDVTFYQHSLSAVFIPRAIGTAYNG